jgi:hypothetical protein
MLDGRGPTRHDGLTRHLSGELVLLYACVIAVAELRTFFEFVARRPKLLLDGREAMDDDCAEAASLTTYFWFPRLGRPTAFDRFEQANRSAFDGGKGVFPFIGARRPDDFADAEVGYYRDPLKRLGRLHQGSVEYTTGFGFNSLW